MMPISACAKTAPFVSGGSCRRRPQKLADLVATGGHFWSAHWSVASLKYKGRGGERWHLWFTPFVGAQNISPTTATKARKCCLTVQKPVGKKNPKAGRC
jgi:hypothetical protein